MLWRIWLGAFVMCLAAGCDPVSPAAIRGERRGVALIQITLADGRQAILQPNAEILADFSWSRQTLETECRRSLLQNFPAFGTLEIIQSGTNKKEYYPLDYFGKLSFVPPIAKSPGAEWRLAQERTGVNLWVEAVIPPGGICDYPAMKGGDMVDISLCGARIVANLSQTEVRLHEDRIYHFDCEPTLFMNLLYPVVRSRIYNRPLLWGFRCLQQRHADLPGEPARALKPLIVTWADANDTAAADERE